MSDRFRGYRILTTEENSATHRLYRVHYNDNVADAVHHLVSLFLEQNSAGTAMLRVTMIHQHHRMASATFTLEFNLETRFWETLAGPIEWHIVITDAMRSQVILSKKPPIKLFREHGMDGMLTYTEDRIHLALPAFGVSVELSNNAIQEEIANLVASVSQEIADEDRYEVLIRPLRILTWYWWGCDYGYIAVILFPLWLMFVKFLLVLILGIIF
jgi:hypothetical protein